MNRILITIIIIMAIWLSACATQNTPTSLPMPTSTLALPTATIAPQVGATPSQFEIGDNDKGKTFAVPVGARVHVVLHNTYWQFDSLPGQVLKQLGAPVVTPDMTVRIPGTGAGTVAVDFQAVTPGQVNIQATRVTCGEALACAQDQKVFQVTVVVK